MTRKALGSAIVLVGTCVAACASGGPSEAPPGSDGGARDASIDGVADVTASDASEEDSGDDEGGIDAGPVSDAGCTDAGATCTQCCQELHPGGYRMLTTAELACACTPPICGGPDGGGPGGPGGPPPDGGFGPGGPGGPPGT